MLFSGLSSDSGEGGSRGGMAEVVAETLEARFRGLVPNVRRSEAGELYLCANWHCDVLRTTL